MHRTCRSFLVAALSTLLLAAPACAQQLTLLGLRAQNHAGAFRGVRSDAAGNLYTLFDAGDGVRLQKYSADGSQLLGEAHIGQNGDAGIALDVDAAGSVYVAGTTNSLGSVTGTSGTAFPNRAGTRTNSFVARFSPQLQQQWLTFCGAEPLAVTSIAVSGGTVYVTGSIFSSTLPVTPSGIQQSPAYGSSGNGFVESFTTASGTLQFATYLTGANGDTAPAALAADNSGNTYIVGTTSATGYPTTAALVPTFRAAQGSSASGFMTKLSPAGDGFVFSTFIPGNGLTSVAVDHAGTGSVLLSGDIATGLFPVTRAQAPIASQLRYQAAVRMALDGSAVLSSTLLAPATQSLVTPTGDGTMWLAGSVQNAAVVPLFPFATVESTGNAFAVHVDTTGSVDRATRFGGLPVANSGYASLPAAEGGIAALPGGSVAFAGSIAPTLSSDLLSSETFDLSLASAPTSSLPSTVRDGLPSADCSGSACSGSAGLLALLAPQGAAPTLALSADDLPNLLLRNLGTAPAGNVQITASGYQVSSECGATLAPAAECALLLTGSGPGSVTVQSSNSPAFTTALPATSNSARVVAVLPRELDFGIVTATSSTVTRTLTVTNLGSTTQTFASQAAVAGSSAYSLTEAASTCTPSGSNSSKVLAAGGSCTVTLALQTAANGTDGAVNAHWHLGNTDILVSGYLQQAALAVSAGTIDFGRQYVGGLRSARYLYVSNSSDQVLSHTAVISSGSAFTVSDGCRASLQPHSVCRIDLSYEAAGAPSSDALTLPVDGLSVTVLGETLPQPSATGAATNPNLRISPAAITFANAVNVTQASSETQTVTISNAGAVAFPLALSSSGDFTFSSGCPAALNGGANCTSQLIFTPTAAGSRQGLLSVTAGSSSPAYVVLSGTGTAILPTTNLQFPDTPLNTPSVQWVKVAESFRSLTVSSSDSNFTVLLVEDTGFGHGTYPASSYSSSFTGSCLNCYLGVQFKPRSTGAQAGSLTITSPGGGQPAAVATRGNGVPLTGLILTPVSPDFGTVPVHSTSATTFLTLTNGTPDAVSTSGMSFQGDFSSTGESTGAPGCAAGTLAAGAACVIPVRFAPSTTGARSGAVTVSTSAGTASATLTGTGAADPGVAFAPTDVRFDNVPGTQSVSQAVTVTNTSSVAVSIGTPVTSDVSFTVSGSCSTLAPGASCTLPITYTPGANLVSGTLMVPVTTSPASAPSTQQYAVGLEGLYTADAAGLQIVPGEHSSVNFGAAVTGTPGLSRVLHVNNLSGKSVVVDVETPRQFALTGSTCNTLAAGAGCDLTVQYTPLTSADVTGTLFVHGTAASDHTVQSALAYLEGYAASGTSTLSVTGNLTPTGVLDFGQVASGQTVTRALTVTNPVGATASITVRRIVSEQPFASTTTCGAPLAAGASCTVTLTYAPVFQAATGSSQNATEADSGSLVLESDSNDAPRVIYLAGSATPVFVSTPNNTMAIAAFTTSQGSLTFTSSAVGTLSSAQTVTVTNTGTTTLHFQVPLLTNGFTANSTCGTLSPGNTCSVAVQYLPQGQAAALGTLELQSDGSASLEFVSLLGQLNSNGNSGQAQAIALAPATLDFGRVLVQNTASLLATVSNTGSQPVTLGTSSIAGDASFSLASFSSGTPCGSAGVVLAAGSSCTVAVTFRPSAVGTFRATLSVTSSATSQPLTLPISGVGTQPQLAASPTAISFGDVVVGSASIHALTLVNTSSSAVDGLAFTASAGFAVNTTCGLTTLNAGSSCAVNVSYTPSAAGIASGVLTITSTDPASPRLVPLNGNGVQATGVAITTLSAAPSALNFGSVAVGSQSTLSFALSNPTGTTASSLLLSATSGFSVTSNCGVALNAYSTCAVLVTFQPLGTGAQAGTVSVQTASNSLPLTVALSGAGANSVPQLTVTPGFLAFGSVPVGSTATLPLTLTNGSSSPVNQIVVSASSGFAVTSTCGTTLNSNSSCTLVVSFSPAMAGAVAGRLLIQSTDPASPLNVALTGTGAVLPPRLLLTPSSLNFGTVPVGSANTLTATLQNTSSSPVGAVAVTASGNFTVASTCGTVLAPGSSCALSVAFSPSLAGAASGLLTVTSNDPASPLTASITGTAALPAGTATGAFTLSATTTSITVQAGLPAAYALTVTPTGNFTGTVALTCTADMPVAYAACSLVPPSVTLAGSAQSSTATVTTVSAVNLTQNASPFSKRELLWCLAPAALLLVPRRRRHAALLVLLASFLITTVGCGGGGDPRIRYVAPGTYSFHVTATSTSGATLASSVALTLTVVPK